MNGSINGAHSSQITTTREIVDAAKAGEYLASGGVNRTPNMAYVRRLAAAMERGEWVVTHQSIAFDREGHLLDGQHRLLAIKATERPVEMLVTRGLAATSFDVMDIGRKRGMADVLSIRGEKQPTKLAASLVWKWRYGKGQMTEIAACATPRELEVVLETHPDLRKATDACAWMEPRNLLPPAIVVWLCYEFCSIDAALGEDFLRTVGSGAELRSDDVRFILRSRLLKNIGAQAKLRPVVLAALTVKAWNAYFTSSPVAVLKWNSPAEGFPSLAGHANSRIAETIRLATGARR